MTAQAPSSEHGRRTSRGSGSVAQRVKAFKAAKRHTWLVKGLRVIFPVLAVAGLGFYALVLKAQFGIGSGTFKPGQVEITAEDLKMKNPTYFGATKDDGKYTVRAREAAVDLSMTGPIKLDGIDGELIQGNGTKTELRATRGSLLREKGEFTLFDGVDIDATSGMKARLKTATVYSKEHRVISKEPLTAEMPTGTLYANSMDLWTEKRRGTFSGDVALRLKPSQTPTGAKTQIGLSADPKQPVDIRSQRFDIDDMAHTATFTGGVTASQGETQLKSATLNVIYESKPVESKNGQARSAAAPAKSASLPGADSGSELTRLTAQDGVVITSTDRRIIADSADFDAKADSALLVGNVEVTQGRNVLRGGRLSVDRKAGKSRLDAPGGAGRANGRIATTFYQSTDPKAATKPKAESDSQSGGFGAFRTDPNAPMDIDAETLDVNDSVKTAVFRGAVNARQGDFHVQTAELNVFYTGQTGLLQSAAGEDAVPKSTGAQISKIETRGSTVIRSKDGQEAHGDNALFDMKANTVVMTGKSGVTLQQGPNVTHGTRLRIDLKTGEARIETDRSGPQVNAPSASAAQQSINAKAGTPPPPQPDGNACRSSTGQPCAVLFPEQLKQANEQRLKKGGETPDARRSTTQGWQPSTSPSPVYRSN